MDRCLIVFAMLCLMLIPHGTSAKSSWTCAEIPDPQKDPEGCGMKEETWVCDPENVMNETTYSGIVRMIQNIQTMDACLCEGCGRNTSFPNTYIKVAVVVVPDIEGGSRSTSKELAGFAECVRSRRWKHAGSCQDDVVVAVTTRTGKIASAAGNGSVNAGLSARCLDSIIASNMDTAQSDINQALYNIVEGIKNSLRGEDYCTDLRPTTLAPVTTPKPKSKGKLSKTEWILIGVAVSLAFIMFFLCCCCCLRSEDKEKPVL